MSEEGELRRIRKELEYQTYLESQKAAAASGYVGPSDEKQWKDNRKERRIALGFYLAAAVMATAGAVAGSPWLVWIGWLVFALGTIGMFRSFFIHSYSFTGLGEIPAAILCFLVNAITGAIIWFWLLHLAVSEEGYGLMLLAVAAAFIGLGVLVASIRFIIDKG